MLERDEGRILNIGSTAGFLAGPYMATYYASKAFVNHFSEALWHEVNGSAVSVTVSCPGPTTTEFAAVAGSDDSKLFKGSAAKSIDVARGGYKAMHKGKRMIVHGFMNKMNVIGLRASPRGTGQRIAKRLNQP
jgi:short-subunit dehydrogenase